LSTNVDGLTLLDTSAAIAYVDPDHEFHSAVRAEVGEERVGLSGHAQFETLSVLTRLPAEKRLTASAAAHLINSEFPESRFLPEPAQTTLHMRFIEAGIAGGAVYDGLVAAAATHHGAILVTCDVRARSTYQAMQVPFRLITTPAH
jgi:predicted nucleic acid-binding protein